MLEAALAAPSQLPPLPEALAADVSEYHRTGGFRGLLQSAAQLADMSGGCAAALDEVDGMLEHEAAEDAAARAEFGDAWTRAPSAAIAVALEERLAGYRQNIAQAQQSDAYRTQRVTAMEGLLAALSPQALVENAPRLEPAPGADDGGARALVAGLCAQVQEMERLAGERAGLEELLKGMKADDDILQKLMATPASGHEALFQKELEKRAAAPPQLPRAPVRAPCVLRRSLQPLVADRARPPAHLSPALLAAISVQVRRAPEGGRGERPEAAGAARAGGGGRRALRDAVRRAGVQGPPGHLPRGPQGRGPGELP